MPRLCSFCRCICRSCFFAPFFEICFYSRKGLRGEKFFSSVVFYAILYTQYIKNVRRCQAFSGFGKAAGSDREKKRQDREEKDRNAEKAKTAEKAHKKCVAGANYGYGKKGKKKNRKRRAFAGRSGKRFPGNKGRDTKIKRRLP